MPTQRIADPYATLGVAREATPSQVRAAYRRLAKRYHPDLHDDSRATDGCGTSTRPGKCCRPPIVARCTSSSVASHGAAPGYGHWAGVPRRAQPAASPQWTSYPGAGAYDRAAAYRRTRENTGVYRGEETGGRLRWGALLLIVPLAVISLAILSAGVLPFPLLGFLLVVIVSSLDRRDGVVDYSRSRSALTSTGRSTHSRSSSGTGGTGSLHGSIRAST